VGAFLPAQLRLVLSLETCLADLLPRLVVAVLPLVQLRLGDFSRIPDERRDRFLVRVIALRRSLDDQPGIVDAMLFEHRHHVEARIGQHGRRAIGRLLETPHRSFDLLRR
jgi:hypothetical protein